MEANDNFLSLLSEMDELRDLAEEAEIQLDEVLHENEVLHNRVTKVEALYKAIRSGDDPVNLILRDKLILILDIIDLLEKPVIDFNAVDHIKRKAGLII